MYQGGNPDQFVINNQVLKSVILPGNNVLSVQIHNENITSSDLIIWVFLSFGIKQTVVIIIIHHFGFNPFNFYFLLICLL